MKQIDKYMHTIFSLHTPYSIPTDQRLQDKWACSPSTKHRHMGMYHTKKNPRKKNLPPLSRDAIHACLIGELIYNDNNVHGQLLDWNSDRTRRLPRDNLRSSCRKVHGARGRIVMVPCCWRCCSRSRRWKRRFEPCSSLRESWRCWEACSRNGEFQWCRERMVVVGCLLLSGGCLSRLGSRNCC